MLIVSGMLLDGTSICCWGLEYSLKALIYRFLHLASGGHREEFQQLMTILRTHGLHNDKNLSVHAYR